MTDQLDMFSVNSADDTCNNDIESKEYNDEDLTGRIFGKLTVVRCVNNDPNLIDQRIVSKIKSKIWECQCSCWQKNIIYLNSKGLIGRKVRSDDQSSAGFRSCGCGKGSVQVNGYKSLYENEKQRSIDGQSGYRKIKDFNIDLSTFMKIVQSNCIYCNSSPKLKSCASGSRFILANGIDRINSDMGYVYGNIVPCCSVCNYAKGVMTPNEYIDHCRIVSSFNR